MLPEIATSKGNIRVVAPGDPVSMETFIYLLHFITEKYTCMCISRILVYNPHRLRLKKNNTNITINYTLEINVHIHKTF